MEVNVLRSYATAIRIDPFLNCPSTIAYILHTKQLTRYFKICDTSKFCKKNFTAINIVIFNLLTNATLIFFRRPWSSAVSYTKVIKLPQTKVELPTIFE